MSINIINANSATTVHINGCGCGPGGAGSSGSGGDGEGLPPGGTEGGNTYDGQARAIDICANVDIFINAMNDYIDQAQVLGYVPGLSTVNAGLEAITSVSLEELDKLEVELSDPKVAEVLRRWVVRLFDDPFDGFTRELLRTLTFRLPLLVGGTLFMPIWRVWAETANIEQLNAQILATAGSASYDGECAELQRSVGREPYRPPSLPESGNSVITYGQYEVEEVASDVTILPGNNLQINAGEQFGFVMALARFESIEGERATTRFYTSWDNQASGDGNIQGGLEGADAGGNYNVNQFRYGDEAILTAIRTEDAAALPEFIDTDQTYTDGINGGAPVDVTGFNINCFVGSGIARVVKVWVVREVPAS